ncbi:MAG: protein FldA, partial [Xanthomonadales bacterium]|nr:protein FldA [Xanthomonadales bacterium]
GLTGTELPTVLRNKIAVMQRMETIRGAAAVAAGIVSDPTEATRGSPQTPRVATVAPAAASPMLSGGTLEATDCDI